MRLYTFTITPNNRKVEAFVRHFDLDIAIHHVSFKDKETQRPEYLAINPMAKVPALVDGDFKLWESNAILTYLATKFPETRALPTDPRGRADADRWLHWQSCHLMPAMGALKTVEVKDLSTLTPLLKILDQQLAGQTPFADMSNLISLNLGVKVSVADDEAEGDQLDQPKHLDRRCRRELLERLRHVIDSKTKNKRNL